MNVPTTTDMNTLANHYFLDTIYHLRNEEAMLLHSRLVPGSEEEEALVADFLELEYRNECLDYPGTSPEYDGAAAIWGARTVYVASQLLLYRENRSDELPLLLPAYGGNRTAGAILSADICLRFLPDILQQAKLIDPDDSLAILLENHLLSWHYSGIGYPLPAEQLNMALVLNNATLQQLYVNRVIARKRRQLALLPALQPLVMAAMGNFANHFWKDL